MTVYLNVRNDLTQETKDKMSEICDERSKKKGIRYTFGMLLNDKFK